MFIQQVTEAINRYRQNKGFIKKLTRTDHPAIRATEIYLNSLQADKELSHQDLFTINHFFIVDHPVKPGKAAYDVWSAMNYQNFCDLNHKRVLQLVELLECQIPLEQLGFATCDKAGYEKFPEHFSKLSLDQLDSRSNSEKMQDFFHVLSQSYRGESFTSDCFRAISKLCVEGMLSQDYIDAMKQSPQASFLANCLIKMKHTDTLTTENQNFIIAYSGSFIVRVTEILIILEKIRLNTAANRKFLADFSLPIPLHIAIKFLEKKGLLTQENFDLISAENNLPWLIALEEIPEALITPESWQDLVDLSKTSNEKECRKDVQAYIDALKEKLNEKQMKKDSLASEEVEIQATKATTSELRHSFFNSPASASPLALQDTESAQKMTFGSTLT